MCVVVSLLLWSTVALVSFLSLLVLSEPSFFQRVIGLFSSKEEPEIKFTTNDIEMTTFSVVSGQSPDVLMPALCCSVAGRTPNGRGWFVNCDRPCHSTKVLVDRAVLN